MELQEKFLHHIWDQRHLIPDLKTVNGKQVKVIYQGQYNTSNGPDFKNVILILDGETIQGDVEIHHRTYDWISHQHHEDPAYNNTILHVVLEHKSNLEYTIKEDAEKIDVLELKDQIDMDIAKLFAQYSENPNRHQVGICDFFKLTSKDQVLPLVKSHGWDRFARKCGRFNAELHFDGFDQLLYNGFMESMGYEKNKFNTISIAHHFTWDRLQEWRSKGLDSITLAAIWLNYSGLLNAAEKTLKDDLHNSLKRAYEYQTFTTDNSQFKWNLFRIRPANHPIKRIIQASIVIVNLLDSGFLNTILQALDPSRGLSNKETIAKIKNKIFKVNSEINGIEKIGEQFCLTIIGNIVLPILYLYAGKTNVKELQRKIEDIYYDFPPLGDNYITNFMKDYMEPSYNKQINSRYIYQQGLMNIYYRFCNYRLCDFCIADKEKIIQSL